jgi:large subunit ribosomal protein L6
LVIEFFYDKEKNKLEFKLGFSHPVYVTVPSGILVRWLKPTKLILKSKNYQQLTQFLAFLRSFRKIDVYKGKGILFKNEKVSLKQGKKS